MGTSQPGFILALIGGILEILGGLIWLLTGSFAGAIFGAMGFGFLGAFPVIIGIWYIIAGIVIIVAGTWMKDPEKCSKGGLMALIASILGFNLLGLIGGILGLIAGKQAPVGKAGRVRA